jgi:hypothetical protein
VSRRSRQARNRCHAFSVQKIPFLSVCLFIPIYIYQYVVIAFLHLVSFWCNKLFTQWFPSSSLPSIVHSATFHNVRQLLLLIFLALFPVTVCLLSNYLFYLVSCFLAAALLSPVETCIRDATHASTQRGTILIHSIWVVILLPAVTSTFFHATWCVRNNQQPPLTLQ